MSEGSDSMYMESPDKPAEIAKIKAEIKDLESTKWGLDVTQSSSTSPYGDGETITAEEEVVLEGIPAKIAELQQKLEELEK